MAMEVMTRREAKARGLRRYFTGKCCKNGHLDERRTVSGHCVECEKQWLAGHQGYVRPGLIEAKKSGSITYISEKPCRRGHFERYVKGGGCLQCHQMTRRAWREDNPGYEKRLFQKPEVRERARLSARKLRYKKQEALAGRKRPDNCELCGSTDRISFDHCHSSGRFRGWICYRCNTTLGRVTDDPVLLRKMAAYLESAGVNQDDVAVDSRSRHNGLDDRPCG